MDRKNYLLKLAKKIVKVIEKEKLTTPEGYHAMEMARDYLFEKHGFQLVTTTKIRPKANAFGLIFEKEK